MRKSRIPGLLVALLGVMALLASLSKPRVEALHRSDVLGLIGSGMCFGVAVVGRRVRGRLITETVAGEIRATLLETNDRGLACPC